MVEETRRQGGRGLGLDAGLPMAVPPVSRDAAATASPVAARRLLGHALGLLIDHVVDASPGRWRFGPLVIVAAAENAATEAVQRVAAARNATLAAAALTLDGATLGRELGLAIADDRLDRLAATIVTCRLVVVDRIDRVTGADAQQALVHLLDAAAASGVTWCVSLPEFPADCLGPQCGSRLGGGLVVRAAETPRSPAAVAGSAPTPGRVIRAVARHHDIPVESLLGPSRSRTVAVARSLAMYLSRRLTGLSLQAIGAACGGRDHTTVLHGVRVCGERISRDPAFAADVERLAATLAGTRTTAPQARRRSGVGSATLERVVANRRRSRRRPA